MFNIYKVDKDLKQKEAQIIQKMRENDPGVIQKKKDKQSKMSENYRARITDFVVNMAEDPVTKIDDYQRQWQKKYGGPKQTRNKMTLSNAHPSPKNIYDRDPSPYSMNTTGTLQLPALNYTQLQLDPLPFRYTSKDTKERVANTLASNAIYDTMPADVDKKSFYLRQRQPEKELAHGTFRTKSFSTVDKLNHMYENDLKILDCEVLGPNAGTINQGHSFMSKKRYSMPQATLRYNKNQDKQSKKQLILTPEYLEQQKKKIMLNISRSAIPGQPEPSTEQIHNMMLKNIQKQQNVENPDLGNRNYMLPSYHKKTHFKAATTLHMQDGCPSLKSNIVELGNKFGLMNQNKKQGNDSNSMLSDEVQGGRNIEPAQFTKAVLQNCGEYRIKDMKVIPTERGTGFMRKLSSIQSVDPARTFFGAGSRVATNLYGGTSKEILESSLMNSQRHIALAGQKGANQNQFQASFMSFGGNASRTGFGIQHKLMVAPIFSNQNISVQNLDIRGHDLEKRAQPSTRTQAVEMILKNKDEIEHLRNYDKEFNEEIADDDSFFDDKISMGQKPDYFSLMEVKKK